VIRHHPVRVMSAHPTTLEDAAGDLRRDGVALVLARDVASHPSRVMPDHPGAATIAP
jgi:hypothetical protein